MSILLPGEAIPPDISHILSNEDTYLIYKVPPFKLIDKEFIEAFVKKGDIYFLSHNTLIDCHDCIALVPPGILILNLTKDTYEQLGLDGQPSIFTPRHRKPMKYVVQIDLTKECFTPGKKNYNRVWWALKNRLNQKCDFLMSWVPHDDKICSSSLHRYFSASGYKISYVNVTQIRRKMKKRQTPLLKDETDVPSQEEHQFVYEWLGAVTCDISCDGSPDDYVSTYCTPEPNTTQDLDFLQSAGFISPTTVLRILEILRKHVKENRSKIPWAALTVHGFADSPVSWKTREHGFYLGGDNLYTYVVFPDQQYWLYSGFSTYDCGY